MHSYGNYWTNNFSIIALAFRIIVHCIHNNSLVRKGNIWIQWVIRLLVIYCWFSEFKTSYTIIVCLAIVYIFPTKLLPRFNWNIVESGVKYHKSNLNQTKPKQIHLYGKTYIYVIVLLFLRFYYIFVFRVLFFNLTFFWGRNKETQKGTSTFGVFVVTSIWIKDHYIVKICWVFFLTFLSVCIILLFIMLTIVSRGEIVFV